MRQSGATYLESGRRYMQSWTGVLSGAMLQHQFDISASYGELAMPSSSLMSIILWPCYTSALVHAQWLAAVSVSHRILYQA